jgi:hypothetical protein
MGERQRFEHETFLNNLLSDRNLAWFIVIVGGLAVFGFVVAFISAILSGGDTGCVVVDGLEYCR